MTMSMARGQVLSWLHDEESLVTSQRIQQHCRKYNDDNDNNDDNNDADNDNGDGYALSRREGSDLLQELFIDDDASASGDENSSKYIATICTAESFMTKTNTKPVTDAIVTPVKGNRGGSDSDSGTATATGGGEYKTTGTLYVIRNVEYQYQLLFTFDLI